MKKALSLFAAVCLLFSANAFAAYSIDGWNGNAAQTGLSSSQAACNVFVGWVSTYWTSARPGTSVSLSSCTMSGRYLGVNAHTSDGYDFGGGGTCDWGGSACTPVAPRSPHGSSVSLGQGLANVGALGLAALAAWGAFIGAPLIGVSVLASAALASGIIAAPGWLNPSGLSNTAAGAIAAAGSPLTVRLAPSDSNAVGSAGSSPGVGVNSSGQFVPSGGGSSSGTGAAGWGIVGGNTANWSYTPAATPTNPTPAPVAYITDSGYTYTGLSAVNGSAPSGTVSVSKYDDGSMSVTDSRVVPVVTSSGGTTTANVGVSTSYDSGGVKIAGSSTATIGPTLGNGSPSNGGAGIAISGSGTGTGAGTGSGSGSGGGGGVGGGSDCQDYPSSIGCSEYGVPDALGAKPVTVSDSGFSGITAVQFTSVEACPADLNFNVLGRGYTFSYAGICQVLHDYVKPILLVVAGALTAFIFVGGFKV